LSIEIPLNSNVQFELTSVTGQILINRMISENARIDIGNLKNGIYVYKLTKNGIAIKHGKLIKRE